MSIFEQGNYNPSGSETIDSIFTEADKLEFISDRCKNENTVIYVNIIKDIKERAMSGYPSLTYKLCNSTYENAFKNNDILNVLQNIGGFEVIVNKVDCNGEEFLHHSIHHIDIVFITIKWDTNKNKKETGVRSENHSYTVIDANRDYVYTIKCCKEISESMNKMASKGKDYVFIDESKFKEPVLQYIALKLDFLGYQTKFVANKSNNTKTFLIKWRKG